MTENHMTASHGGAKHGSLISYIIGFVLSVILTIISFYVVINQGLSKTAIVMVLGLMAALQIFVQSAFFLHVSVAPEKRVDLISYAFSLDRKSVV